MSMDGWGGAPGWDDYDDSVPGPDFSEEHLREERLRELELERYDRKRKEELRRWREKSTRYSCGPTFKKWDHNDFAKNDFKERCEMAKIQAKQVGTKVWTGEVRLSYANVWTPSKQMGSDQEKYSVSLIIPKSDTDTIKAIKAAMECAKEQGKSKKWGGKIPAKLQLALNDGDVDREDHAEYANSYFVNAKSNNKPGIVDINAAPIMDQSEVYSGCYARVTLNFYPYEVNGNKGVAAGLGNIQKIRDGESLGGSPSRAEDDFEAIELPDDFLD